MRRALAAIAVGLMVLGAAPAMAQIAFYTPKPDEVPGQPGTIIYNDKYSDSVPESTRYRILYRSTGLKGEPIAVSGMIIVPDGNPPAGGWPIVAWAHPTTGIDRSCAPSMSYWALQSVIGAEDLVRQGYVVVATDYPGLGTVGPHPYLIGVSEGRAVLDSIRVAAQFVENPPESTAVIWGHSQGGQAALYAAALAKDYAPELKIAGVAAAAPATNFSRLIKNDLPTPGGKNLFAMALTSWSQLYGYTLDGVVEPEAMPVLKSLATTCILDIVSRTLDGDDLQRHFLVSDDITQVEPWRTTMLDNTIGVLPTDIPVLLIQGTADTTVEPAVTESYFKLICGAGSSAAYVSLPGVEHIFAALKGEGAFVAWAAGRFAGAKAPNDCAK